MCSGGFNSVLRGKKGKAAVEAAASYHANCVNTITTSYEDLIDGYVNIQDFFTPSETYVLLFRHLTRAHRTIKPQRLLRMSSILHELRWLHVSPDLWPSIEKMWFLTNHRFDQFWESINVFYPETLDLLADLLLLWEAVPSSQTMGIVRIRSYETGNKHSFVGIKMY